VLLPHLANVQVEGVPRVGRLIRVAARTRSSSAVCPGCGAESRRVHSRYERRLLDTAAGGCEVVICLTVRRFRCLAVGCPKATFAEQAEGLASRHARRTPAVTAVLEAVALALGGRAGARLSGRLAAQVSRMTLPRLVRALPDPAVPAGGRRAQARQSATPGSDADMNMAGPQRGLVRVGFSCLGKGVVKCEGRAAGIGAVVGEFAVDQFGDCGRRAVFNGPEGTDHVRVSSYVEGRSDMNHFVG
jgi:hypothetical protein